MSPRRNKGAVVAGSRLWLSTPETAIPHTILAGAVLRCEAVKPVDAAL